MTDIRVQQVSAAATVELRRRVLRPGRPADVAMASDTVDAVHMSATSAGDLLGACVLLPRPYPGRPDATDAWQLRGMAVEPAMQGRGVGGALLAGAVDELRARRAHLVWCDARTMAVPFYDAHGFTADGAPFQHAESGVEHVRMWRELSAATTSSEQVGPEISGPDGEDPIDQEGSERA